MPISFMFLRSAAIPRPQISRFGFVPFFALATQCRALKTRRWSHVSMRCQLGCFTPFNLRSAWLIVHRRPCRF